MQEGHNTLAVPLKTTGRHNEHLTSAGCVTKLNTRFASAKSPITPIQGYIAKCIMTTLVSTYKGVPSQKGKWAKEVRTNTSGRQTMSPLTNLKIVKRCSSILSRVNMPKDAKIQHQLSRRKFLKRG
jgi:hypothetical protein